MVSRTLYSGTNSLNIHCNAHYGQDKLQAIRQPQNHCMLVLYWVLFCLCRVLCGQLPVEASSPLLGASRPGFMVSSVHSSIASCTGVSGRSILQSNLAISNLVNSKSHYFESKLIPLRLIPHLVLTWLFQNPVISNYFSCPMRLRNSRILTVFHRQQCLLSIGQHSIPFFAITN